MHQTYTHSDIMKIFPEIKARTLISWSERELLTPLQAASGRGSSRLYSYSNLVEISIINELLQYGIPFAQIRTIMQNEGMSQIIKDQQWEMVYLIVRSRENGVDSPISIITYPVKIENFLETGAMIIAYRKPVDKKDAIRTSTIAINIFAHEHFVRMKTQEE